ncbi:MAG: MucR family transcriptional regulator [Alphaproteobacteria bacterium]|nr:MucR family transcriptional regulator [Alphaproteobacteria bacterium]USO07476.1 MAG: MucR family transcriptional regulator [Rhodospirillales bacterium]
MSQPASSNAVNTGDILALTAQIVASYLSGNTVPAADIPALIDRVHKTLANVGAGGSGGVSAERPHPAVSIKKSVQPDYIVCLEDGRKLKMLKRHLKSAYNLTPEAYRERWGLPSDYPMVAPNYAAKRSKLAKNIGLGKRRKSGRKAK